MATPTARRAILLPVVVAGALLSGSAAREPGRPEALHHPPPVTPVETAGTGLAPEVTVDLGVDPEGRVVDVVVRAVAPSTEFDDLFRRATEGALSRWRFSPAGDAAAPGTVTVRRTVRFDAVEDQPDEVLVRHGLRALLYDDGPDTFTRRWDVVALPLDRRLELLGALARQAERHLEPGRRREASTEHFRVITDATQPDVAATLARNLEAGFAIVNGLWSETVPPQPGYGRVLAYLFSTRDAYRDFSLAARRAGYEWSAGFYAPEGLIALHLEMGTREHLREVMLHETVHAFLDRHVVRPGARIPLWLDEGLADYVGNSQLKRKKLVPGKHRKHQVYHVPGGMLVRRSISQMEASKVKAAIREGDAVPLEELVAAERDKFYGERRRMFYTQSWMLVHFLRHGEEDWAVDRFPRFLLWVSEGYPAAEAFRAAWGRTPAEMESAFRVYVERF